MNDKKLLIKFKKYFDTNFKKSNFYKNMVLAFNLNVEDIFNYANDLVNENKRGVVKDCIKNTIIKDDLLLTDLIKMLHNMNINDLSNIKFQLEESHYSDYFHLVIERNQDDKEFFSKCVYDSVYTIRDKYISERLRCG